MSETSNQVVIFGEIVPDWIAAACSDPRQQQEYSEQHLDETLEALREVAKYSLSDLDELIIRLKQGYLKGEAAATAAYQIMLFHAAFRPFRHAARGYVSNVDLTGYVLGDAPALYKFGVHVIVSPNGHIYRRLLTLDPLLAETYLFHSAMLGGNTTGTPAP